MTTSWGSCHSGRATTSRALRIPVRLHSAIELLSNGEISSVDLGCVRRAGEPPAYFAHAATAGLNVDFSRLATRASIRARLGRLTYLMAGVYALHERSTFRCTLRHDGIAEELDLLQLSVISAPVIGGSLGLTVRGPNTDDHLLDVLAIEDIAPPKMLRAGIFLLMGIKEPVEGVRAMHVEKLAVESQTDLGLALDGELSGSLPGQFETLAGAVRVITPPSSGR